MFSLEMISFKKVPIYVTKKWFLENCVYLNCRVGNITGNSFAYLYGLNCNLALKNPSTGSITFGTGRKAKWFFFFHLPRDDFESVFYGFSMGLKYFSMGKLPFFKKIIVRA